MPRDIVNALPGVLLHAAEAQIATDGSCPQPQVHIFREDLEQVYLGYLTCRRFYRGADAAAAIEALGLLPSVLAATRLLVAWEDHDLRTALQLPGEGSASGMALLDARRDGHTLHWHPLAARGRENPDGTITINVRWGTSAQYADVPLLAPVAGLLRLWRELRAGDPLETVEGLEAQGYELAWAAPIR